MCTDRERIAGGQLDIGERVDGAEVARGQHV
jgi:hypothetical protein